MELKKNTPIKNALGDALYQLLDQKTFGKISVQELCDRANVSRSTFYANFQDKYQLLFYCVNHKTSQEMAPLSPPIPLKKLLEEMLSYFKKERNFFFHVFSDGTLDELIEIFYQFFNQHFIHALHEKEKEGITLPAPADVIASFYIGGLTMMTLRWIKTNYKMPVEELASYQYNLLKLLF